MDGKLEELLKNIDAINEKVTAENGWVKGEIQEVSDRLKCLPIPHEVTLNIGNWVLCWRNGFDLMAAPAEGVESGSFETCGSYNLVCQREMYKYLPQFLEIIAKYLSAQV